MIRHLIASFCVVAVLAGNFSSGVLEAAPVLDWSIPNGHHFTQANGFPTGTSPMGFTISDDDQAKFWSAFQSLGGVAHLGYPASQRFLWGGFVTQVTQKAVMQWRPEKQSVDFVNVFDDLGQQGKNDWLLTVRSIPAPAPSSSDVGLNWSEIVTRHQDFLRTRPALFAAYLATPDAIDLYGLPMSPVYDAGPMYVVRLQRAVLQEWKVKQPWANVGDVTVANGGDVAKESGSFPSDQLRPTAAPTTTWPTSTFSITGIATWYGPGFAGKTMANGQIYQPSDATTTAANAFPLGSVLRVSSSVTKKSILVTVRDTGSFAYPRVTDLSPAAFSALGMSTSAGIMQVTVELVQLPPGPTPTPSAAPTPGSVTTKTQAPPSR